MIVNNIWKWYENGTQANNIEMFTENLKKANKQESFLLAHQKLPDGAINMSAMLLVQSVAQSPENMDKAVAAAVEMNRFCIKHKAKLNNPNFTIEKLAIPAMLDVLTKNAAKSSHSTELLLKSKLIVSTAKNNLSQDSEPTMRNVYDQYMQTFTQVYQECTSQKSMQNNDKANNLGKQILSNGKTVYRV